ncbi:hypothetical protein MTBBW1_10063 [Desulfamplus magnetovallimortis]|uniref:Uncharacterized protein n=1 Tax=Desulfamplus magnetovallimortis TaxID=1246637 RepID=A0A1W1H4N2_9BACT|nr:hypothetical protein MTBBW1_10063 [Desulfamplus magnetovallimortis]
MSDRIFFAATIIVVKSSNFLQDHLKIVDVEIDSYPSLLNKEGILFIQEKIQLL